jgi:hypothetical protein
MSRFYEMTVAITEFDKKRKDAIVEVCQDIWNFDDPCDYADGKSFEMHGQDSLCGGEVEEQFTDRLAKAVWKANKKYCLVEVRATYLESLPCEHYARNRLDYKRLMKRKSKCAKK